jgi:hypothetical protein
MTEQNKLEENITHKYYMCGDYNNKNCGLGGKMVDYPLCKTCVNKASDL